MKSASWVNIYSRSEVEQAGSIKYVFESQTLFPPLQCTLSVDRKVNVRDISLCKNCIARDIILGNIFIDKYISFWQLFSP